MYFEAGKPVVNSDFNEGGVPQVVTCYPLKYHLGELVRLKDPPRPEI